MKNDKKYESILERAAELFDLPGEVVAGLPKITVTGCRTVHIENHHGILEYGGEEICINGGKVRVRVTGEGLELRSMNAEELLITGSVNAIAFEL